MSRKIIILICLLMLYGCKVEKPTQARGDAPRVKILYPKGELQSTVAPGYILTAEAKIWSNDIVEVKAVIDNTVVGEAVAIGNIDTRRGVSVSDISLLEISDFNFFGVKKLRLVGYSVDGLPIASDETEIVVDPGRLQQLALDYIRKDYSFRNWCGDYWGSFRIGNTRNAPPSKPLKVYLEGRVAAERFIVEEITAFLSRRISVLRFVIVDYDPGNPKIRITDCGPAPIPGYEAAVFRYGSHCEISEAKICLFSPYFKTRHIEWKKETILHEFCGALGDSGLLLDDGSTCRYPMTPTLRLNPYQQLAYEIVYRHDPGTVF